MGFRLHRPETVGAALGLARECGPGARYLAGGTDLIIQINRGRCTPSDLIALDRIGELSGIDASPDRVEIGALTTMKTIESDARLIGALAALPEAARVVGGHQIRNVATIGGNIANASPAADLLPVLLALDAEVELAGPGGARRIPLGRFLHGPGVTASEPGELLRRVACKRPPANAATAFVKAGRRRAMEISIVCVAALLSLDENGRVREARRVTARRSAGLCRRRFLTNAALAGLGGFSPWNKSLAAEPPPEITTIRFEKDGSTCIAPQAFQELLRAEGFTDIRYVDATEAHIRRADAAKSAIIADMIAHGEVDFGRDFAPGHLLAMNAGAPITILAGLHLGCFEVFGKSEIRTLADLKGRTVGTTLYENPGDRPLLTIMASLVGLDPAGDIHWVTDPKLRPMDLFIEGKIDAFLAAPPGLQEVRARNIGHVIVSSITDRPWSQYYCCLLATQAEFARKYPVATKRALRAILKAADLCVSEPKRVTQLLVDQGYTTRYDYALQALGEIRYDVLAGVRPGGHAALLCAAAARGGSDRVRARTSPSPSTRIGASSTRSNAS